ncbi:MAG TPA: hypothetical protein VH880_14115 [Anaeromyxobacteraceae bacterium]
MPVCPVCEHHQPSGDDCEVCGKRLAGTGASPSAIAAIEGLEPTAASPVEVAPDRIAELEPTRLESGGDAAPGAAAGWIEETRARPVAAAVEPVPDLERHRAEALPDDRPDPPSPATCRYCRAPAAPGDRICGRCGMKLPVFDARRIAAELAGMLCRDCGARGEGPRCRRCGARMVSAT